MEKSESHTRDNLNKGLSDQFKEPRFPAKDVNEDPIAKFFSDIGLGTEEERAKFRFTPFHSAEVEEEQEDVSFRVLGNSDIREQSPYA